MSETPSDPAARRLVEHTDFLRAVARRLVRDADRADDLVQDTCVAALKSEVPPRAHAGGWLAGIARNLARMTARSEIRRRNRERAVREIRAVPDPAGTVARLETEERLIRAVRELPEPYRGTLVARFFDGLSAAAIGRREDIPASTVRTRVERALAMLRERMDRHAGGDRRAWIGALLPIAFPLAGTTTALGAGTASALAQGATIVTAKKTVVTALLVLLAAVLGSLVLFPGDAPDAPPAGNGDGMMPPPAVADGRGDGEAVPVEANTYPAPVDLDAADRDLDLHGRVVDAEQNPVPGAKVETIRWPWRRSSVMNLEGCYRPEAGPATRSSSDGSFLLRFRRGAQVDLRVVADGYAVTRIPRCQAGERLLVVLEGGAEVEVRCRDDADAPVPGVDVRLSRGGMSLSPVLRRRGRTDGSGRLVFRAVTKGSGILRFEHPVLGSPGNLMREIPPTGRLTVEVTLLAGREIRGRVTDAETGEPIAVARVGMDRELARAVVADDLGRFRFPDLAPGRYVLTVKQRGYPRLTREVVIPNDEDLLDVEIRRTGGRRVTVRVVGPGDAPIAGAYIASRSVGLVLKGRTGADGRVVLAEVPARTIAIYVHSPAPDVLPLPAVTIHPGETEVTVRFEAASLIRGVVLDPDGKPMPSMLVVARTRERARLTSGDTDAEGRFRLKLRKGTAADLFVTGQKAGGGMSFVPVHGRAPGLTAPADDVVIRTERVESGRSLTVLVLDTRGRPLAGAEVSVSAQGRFQYQPSGPDGTVSFADLPATETRIWVQPPESSVLPENAVNPKQAVVVPDGQRVEMRFRVGEMLVGIVRGPDGEPFAGAIISVMSLEGVSQNLRSGEDGRFRCPAALGVDHYVRAGGQDADGKPLNGFLERVRPEDGEVEIRLAGPPR